MQDPPKHIVFCGTDTGVGKTFVAVALVRALRARGLDVGVLKPIESGCETAEGELFPADAAALARAADLTDLRIVCPWPLPRAQAPAAELTRLGMRVAAAEIRRAAGLAAAGHDVLVIESAGGVLSPLTPSLTSADLATLFDATTVLVVRSRLGCIGHAAAAAEILRDRGARVGALVLNEADEGVDHDLHAEWIDRACPELNLVRFRSDASALAALLV